MLSGVAKLVGPQKYLYTGKELTFHSFADLSAIAESFVPLNLRHFLPGSFVFEFKDKRHRELLETPEACACRLGLA